MIFEKKSDSVKYANPEGSPTWEYASAASCSSMIFCIGCVLGWTSPALGNLMGNDSPISFNDSDASVIVSSFSVAFRLAPLLAVVMADRFGRKNSLLVISVPMILNWGLIAAAKDVTVLFIARFLAGVSGGLGLCLAPMYLGEIASVKLRGALGMLIGTMANAGLLSVFLVVPYMSLSTSGLIYLCIATASMVSLWFIPETPYFLAIRGKVDAAEDALEQLRGKTDVAEELELINRTISYDGKQGEEEETETRKKSNVFKQLVTVPGNRRGFFIIFLFVFALQCGGYVILMIYSHVIFEAMKTSIPASTCGIIVAVIQLVFNILTTFLVDKYGRRPLILISGVISGICTLVVAVYFYLLEHTDVDVIPYGILPAVSIFVYIAAVSVGLMPLQHVVQSEILSTEVKALVGCVVGVAAGAIVTVTSSLYLKLAITWGYGHCVNFFGFSIATWVSTGLILMMLPETKGKTFLDIQIEMNA